MINKKKDKLFFTNIIKSSQSKKKSELFANILDYLETARSIKTQRIF